MPLQNLRGNPFGEMYEDNPPRLAPDRVRVSIKLGESYIRPLFVIVECYDHKKYGRGKREYMRQFSEKERKTISHWYGRLYDYYLRRGIPVDGVDMMPSTLELLRRAADFFASL